MLDLGRILQLTAFAAALLHMPLPAQAGDADPHAHHAPGMRISIDPETGEIVVPPPSAQSPAGAPRAAQLPPLEVVPGTSPAGGEMIDLQERFHTSVVTSVGGDGEATTECLESGGKGTR